VIVKRARKARVNGLIDFTSGWLVANIGHDTRRVMRAVRKARGWAVLDRWENPARVAAEAALRSTLPPHLDHINFYSSGSEAMDAAIRCAGGPVVAHPRAFHGSTIGAQSIPRMGFMLPQGIGIGTCGASIFTSDSCNVVETFHGPWCEWHDESTIALLRKHQAQGTVLIFDEMQSGFGRTGRWWGFDHYDVEPDIVVGGKAIAGGFPLAFVAARHEIIDGKPMWESTFSGNALSCAALVETVKEIRRRQLLQRVLRLEPMIREAFPTAQGKGFAYAFDHPDADAVADRALERGLMLLHTGRGTVKICPPLVISERDLALGLGILKGSV